jgi:proline iminopeptidase
MHVDVNGTRLWFDVDGPAFVPDGARLVERPTIVLVHGGPGTYDHSYFKPDFARLTDHAQLVYLDLRGHGRSAREDEPSAWTFEACADDLRAFCDSLGISRPIVFGHSMGGFIAMLYAARHPAHPAAVILQSTIARFDLARLIESFRSAAGDEVARLAGISYGETPVGVDEWARVFAAFGPRVPDQDALARRVQHLELSAVGMDLIRRLDVVDQLSRVACPALVCVGRLDPVTPVSAAEEIVSALPAQVGHLEVLEGAGHFPWLDCPGRYWPVITSFVTATAAGIDYSK